MNALYERSTKFTSKLDSKKDIAITIDGVYTIIEFSYHSIKRGMERAIYESALVFMVQRGFDEILDLKNGERFIVIDKELRISFVGALNAVGTDIIISIVSAIDSAEPSNHRGTHEIAI